MHSLSLSLDQVHISFPENPRSKVLSDMHALQAKEHLWLAALEHGVVGRLASFSIVLFR